MLKLKNLKKANYSEIPPIKAFKYGTRICTDKHRFKNEEIRLPAFRRKEFKNWM
jgi:hypothetical protein